MAVNIKNRVLWDVTPCSLVDRYQSPENHITKYHNASGHNLLRVWHNMCLLLIQYKHVAKGF
jgi:hypothetical protein